MAKAPKSYFETTARKRYACIIKTIMFLSIMVFILFLCGFLRGRNPLNFSLLLDTNVTGQFGDFVGGVIGTVVSAVLLYYTFKLQREDSEAHMIVYKTELLNDTFIHLINMYNKTLENYIVEIDGGIKLHGKEALHYRYDEIYQNFVPSNNPYFNLDRKQAIGLFQSFYSITPDFSPIFFRTMYRMFKILDTDDDETEFARIELMKLLRAQLTGTELALLRYNAMTKQGQKFVLLILKFHILKHMPPLELMEYKQWRDKMSMEEREYTNELLMIAKQNIIKVTEESSHNESYSNNIKTYNINVSTNEARTELQICLYINMNAILKNTDLIKGICKLSSDERMSLMHFFIIDCLVISSYERTNKYTELQFADTDDSANGRWYVRVTNNNGQRIRMRV